MLPMPLPPAATTSQIQVRQTAQAYLEHLSTPAVPPSEVEQILEFATAHPTPELLTALARRTTGRQLEATLRAAVAQRGALLADLNAVLSPEQARSLSPSFLGELADAKDFSVRSFASSLGTIREMPQRAAGGRPSR